MDPGELMLLCFVFCFGFVVSLRSPTKNEVSVMPNKDRFELSGQESILFEAISNETGSFIDWPHRWTDHSAIVSDNDLEPVGHGSFGDVFVTQMCDGDVVAIKRILPQVGKSAPQLQTEVIKETHLLAAFSDNEHFAAFYDYASSHSEWYIAMEAATGGTLASIVKSETVTQATKFLLFRDMVEGVLVMKQRNIVHRDLKPANILISSPCSPKGNCHAKTGDLGGACRLKTTANDQAFEAAVLLNGTTQGTRKAEHILAIPECNDTWFGTPEYYAPEQWGRMLGQGPQPDYSNDVWALGIMLYALRCGHHPQPIETCLKIYDPKCPSFSLDDPEQCPYDLCLVNAAFGANMAAPCKAITDTPDSLDPLITELLVGMLAIRPLDRMKVEDIREKIAGRGVQDHRAKAKVAAVPECWCTEDKARKGTCPPHSVEGKAEDGKREPEMPPKADKLTDAEPEDGSCKRKREE